jgi:hypothetical protein
MRQFIPPHLLLAVTAACLTILPSAAKADYNLGAAANYGLIAGPSVTSETLSGSTINNNVGVAGATNFTFMGGTINGSLDFSGPGPATGNTSGTIVNGIDFNNSNVTAAYNAIASISNTATSETGSALSGSSISLSNYTADGDNNYVFTVSSSAFLSTSGLTINGTAGQSVVINVSAGNVAFNNSILLTGGIDSNHVFINIEGSGYSVTASNGSTISGVVSALGDSINLTNAIINGRIIGGGNSGFVIGAAVSLTSVPEPSSLVMLLVGGTLVVGRSISRSRVAKGRKLD